MSHREFRVKPWVCLMILWWPQWYLSAPVRAPLPTSSNPIPCSPELSEWGGVEEGAVARPVFPAYGSPLLWAPAWTPFMKHFFCPEIKCGEACQGSGQRPAWELSLRRDAEVTAKGPARLESLLSSRRCVKLRSPECESCRCLWVASACNFLPHPLRRQHECSGHCGP